MTRVLLADDNQEVRKSLRLVLETSSQSIQCTESTSAVNVLAHATAECPNVVLLDAELTGLACGRGHTRIDSLAELIDTLKILCPPLRIIVLSAQPGIEQIAFTIGAHAFLSKSDLPETMLTLLAGFGYE